MPPRPLCLGKRRLSSVTFVCVPIVFHTFKTMSTFKPNLHVKDLFVCLCWLRRYILALCTQYSDHIATAGKGVLLYMLYSQTSPRREPWTIWNRPTCFSEKPTSPPGMLSRSLTLRSTTTTPSVLASELDNATGLTTIGQLKVPGYNEAGAQRLEAFWGMVCGLDVNDRA